MGPQNLLLDAKYNLKITDFGLSKIIQSDADAIMKTTYVGTRGYQAPELLLNQKYDLKCDIFSVGVILFILLAGYPPFEQASKNDKWFKPLIKNNIDKFWKAHQKSPIAQIPEAKDLLTQMLCFDPKKRIDMNSIKTHKWMSGPTLKQKELITEIRDRHRKAEKKRRQDVRKMNDLAQSLNPNKPIPGIEKAKLKLFPQQLVEGVLGEAYTYLEKDQKWYDLYNMLEEAITEKGKGQVKFNIEILESRLWKDRYLEMEDSVDEIKESNEHQIFVVRVTRTDGDTLVFNKLKNGFMLTYCSSIIKGLPDWARKLEKQDIKKEDEENDAKEAEVEDEEYEKALDQENIFKDANADGIKGLKLVTAQ